MTPLIHLMRAFLPRTLAIGIVLLSVPPVEAADSIERQISYKDGSIWVHDTLHMGETFAGANGDLWKLFQEIRDGKTNILSDIQTVMHGEDVEVQEYSGNRNGDYVDLRVLSKVRSESPAKLHWVLTFEPNDVGLGKGKEIEILMVDKNYIAWVPELSDNFKAFREFDRVQISFDQNFNWGEQFRCALKEGERSEMLLSWNQQTNGNAVSHLSTLEKPNAAHKMSGSDQMALFTALKIAKSRYYIISPVETGKPNGAQ